MSTKNHKPATTSDIVPGTLSSEVLLTKEDPHSETPAPKSSLTNTTRARCGKVARLPKEIRDQLNEMLLDGVPHAQIIQKLQHQFGPQSNVLPLNSTQPDTSSLSPSCRDEVGRSRADAQSDFPLPVRRGEARGEGSVERDGVHSSTAPESPNTEDGSAHSPQNSAQIENPKSKIENLTPHHLTTWKKFGGYRDWLKDQQRIVDCKLRHELTLDLARSAEGLASYQAAPKVAVAQICQTIVDLGPEGIKEAMQASPLNCFRLLNALARLINSGLKCETQIHKAATAATDGQKPQPVDRAEIQRIEKDLNLL
jgi:hypothetical protein